MALGTCLCPEANDNRHLPFDLGPAAKPSFPNTSETLPPSPRRFRQQSPLRASRPWSLSWACRRAQIRRALPHSAAPQFRRISLTTIAIDVCAQPRSRSHNPKVVGSIPTPAISGKPHRSPLLRIPATVAVRIAQYFSLVSLARGGEGRATRQGAAARAGRIEGGRRKYHARW